MPDIKFSDDSIAYKYRRISAGKYKKTLEYAELAGLKRYQN